MQNTVTRETRFLLWLVIVVIAPYGFFLYFYPGGAGNYWAWEISQPRTAVLIGSIYLAATFDYIVLTRQKEWLLIRSTLFSLFLVAAWLLVAAMLHWNSFYPYRFFTLSWLAAYYFPLFAVPLVFRIQDERFRENLQGDHLSQGWRTWLLIRGVVYAVVSILIFIFADNVSTLWPWGIEPVNLRMFSGQIFVFGAFHAYAMRDGLWRRLKFLMLLAGLLALTHLIGLVITGGPYDWSSPIGILLPLMFVEWLVTSLALWRAYK
jgi:hypothetical protein